MASYLVHKKDGYQLLAADDESSVREYILIPVDGAGFVVLEHDLSAKKREGG